MFSLANTFGGLLSRPEPHLIGPNRAQALSNVNLDAGSLQAQRGTGADVTTLQAGTYRSLYKFGGAWVNDAASVTTPWQYVEYRSLLFRAAAGTAPQKSANGSTWYTLGVPAPASAATVATGAAGALTGAYQYYVTNVGALGGESAPNPISGVVNPVAQKVDLSAIPVSADPQVTARKLYRVGGTVAAALLVTTLNDNTTTTYTDNTADTALGAALATTLYAVPAQWEGVALAPYGRLFGWVGNRLYYSESGSAYDAVPATNFVDFPEAIKGVVAYSGQLLILTSAQPYLLIGTGPSSFSIVGIPSQQGCLERDTVVDMGHSIFYLSNDGLCAFSGRTVEVISKAALADSLLAGASATNAKAVRYNERYILFVQGGASFPAGGYVEWDERTAGNWKQGTVAAVAAHYNRTDDKLYVVPATNVVKQWEDPAATTLAGSYTTGAWVEGQMSLLKHWTQGAVDHSGPVTLTATIDGVTVINALALTQGATVKRSRFRFPPGCKGRQIQLTLAWAAAPAAPVKVVEVLDNVARKAAKL